ncbi:MAG: biotin/lipoyl-binding protein [candidate division SR1 bacterium]|nr:biotin/lipoyl-binding protein [candidate division SR1 bacterium]RKW23627.1 MAG: biotin/lipoyl-binding protein [Candidatus Gracilibacteria bacterium]
MQLIKRFFSWIWEKKWRVLAILVIGGLGGYRAIKKFFPEKPVISYTSSDHVVGTGDVEKTLNLAGTTQFAHAQKLTFISEGRVTSVKVKVGDTVKKGQVLATISTDNLDKDIEDLKRNLKNAQQDLKKAIEKSNKDLDILKAQAEYDLLLVQKQTLPGTLQLETQTKASAVSEAESTIKLAESTIKTKERELKDKQKELEDIQADYQKLQSGDKGALLSTPETTRNWNNKMLEYIREFRNEANKLQKTLDAYDAVVKLSSTYTADDRNIYLGAKNDAAMNRSKNKYWDVSAYVGKLHKLYDEYSKLPLEKITKNQILSGYSIFTQLGEEFKEWGKINIDAFGDSIETADMPKSKILEYVDTFGRAYEILGESYLDKNVNIVDTLAKLKTAETPLEEIKDKLDKAKVEVEQAQVALLKAKTDLETAKNKTTQESLKYQLANQENTVKAAELEQKLKEAKEKLDDAKSGETQRETLQKSRDAVDSAQLALTTKMKEYDNYKITANFDGVVTKVNMQIGDSIGSSRNSSDTDTKYIYVETPDLLEVKLEVDQIDIVKIGIGMNVEVYIDAFQGSVYTGVFSEIDTMPEGSSYKARVVFKKASAEDKIFGGMSANVKVILESEKGKVVVPTPAIADNEQGEKIVSLKKGDKWIDQVVETGISDDMNTVILSGVKVGDTIKGFYMNETSATNLGLNQKGGPSGEHDVTTAADGSMSYQYDG